jgi:hypothetical protein
MSTISRTISDWAARVQYEDLPPEVVHEAKRSSRKRPAQATVA